MTNRELADGTAAVRQYVNQSSYGSYISDDVCRDIAAAVLMAAYKARPKPKPAPGAK